MKKLTTQPNSPDSYSQPDFVDTNVRTEGVAEPDAVKTDGEYIYMTDSEGTRLTIYRVKDGEIKSMGTNQILEEDYSFRDLFISGDTLIVLGNINPTSETFINFYDVSDKGSPKLEKTLLQDGYYSSSRVIGSKLYTFSYKYIDTDNYSKDDIGSYVPSVDGEVLLPEDLIVYENAHGSYLVVTSVDTDEQSFESQKAVMGGATIPYVSENAIYTQINRMKENSDTILIKIELGNGNLAFKCDGTFKGSLLNDYSIDEYNGYVRFVTSYQNDDGNLRNSLYVLDENLEKVSVIKELAPNETVKSARFMGDIVYFVTYKVVEQFYDPLFASRSFRS
jgi:Secreted protein containing C-terminal beta-propeller domain distantly related to WD-40 repeats